MLYWALMFSASFTVISILLLPAYGRQSRTAREHIRLRKKGDRIQ